ncbi:hypothetical protein BGW80DRAFT_1379587 [Lactifluus volemus]|nr:hypothetical protein BGW80DRAFT_1379587 [Lactifluus volemus]
MHLLFLMAHLHWWRWWFVAYLLSLENQSLVVLGSSRTPHTVGSAKMTIILALEATTTGIHLNNINLLASSDVTY